MHILKQLKNTFMFSLVSLQLPEGASSGPENSTETVDKMSELEKKIDGLQNKLQFTDGVAKSLYRGLSGDPSIKDDPEAKDTIAMFKRYQTMSVDAKQELNITLEEAEEFTKMGDKYEFVASANEHVETNKKTPEQLKNITNQEFLSLPEEERLQYVTKNHVDSENISNGSVNDVEFTFANDDLYRLTTAGQIMPDGVKDVVVDGQEYIRSGFDGEFFNGNQRLVIHENTNLEVNSIQSYDEYLADNQSRFDELNKLNNNPNFDIAKEAFDRGIDMNFAINILGESLDPKLTPELRQAKIESLFTDFDRIRNVYNLEYKSDGSKIPDELALRWINKIDSQNYKELAKEYDISEESISKIKESGLSNITIDMEKYKGKGLEEMDLRIFKDKYPNEASLKNNNPAGITFNNTFSNTLNNHGIIHERGTSRPSSERGAYFMFPNMKEGMKAFELLWDIKLNKMENKTFGDFAKNWAADTRSYERKFGNVWDTKIKDLDTDTINTIKLTQMRIESPGMYTLLKRSGAIA